MAEQKARQASQISFDEVTEAAVGGVLRALESHRKASEVERGLFKLPPIIFGIWIMPEEVDLGRLQDIVKRPGARE